MKLRLAPLLLPLLLAALGCGSANGADGADGTASDNASALTSSAALVHEASSVLGSLRTTRYQHETYVNAPEGIFDVDCSGFTNFALETAAPAAFSELQNATVSRPVAASYVDFVHGLGDGEGSWRRVTKVRDLVPGDVIAWLTPAGVISNDTGHVMILDADPVLVDDEAHVVVIDSTATGHGDADPRGPGGASGVGRGTTVVLMNDDGTASGYRWSTDSDSPPYTTDVVMAHLD